MMNPAKIQFFCANDPSKGAPHATMPARWLASLGYDVECICLGPRERTELHSPLGTLKTQCIPQNSGALASVNVQLQLFWEILRRRFQRGGSILYLAGSPVAPAAWLALLFARRERIIYHSQDFLEPGRHRFWEFFEKRLARRAGHVLWNEPNRARFAAGNYKLKAIPTVVRTALPRHWPMPEFGASLRRTLLSKIGRADDAATRLVMHQGACNPVRCTAQLAEAVRLLPENYVLVMTDMASADERKLEPLTRAGIRDRTILLGHLNYDELLRHSAVCDIGVLLYPDDGVGNFYQAPGRLTEYMGVGLPIVTSHFPGLELLTLKHRLGRTCDPRSPAEIARALRELGDLPADALSAQRVRLRALAKTDFAFEVEACRIEELIQKLSPRSLAGKSADQPLTSPCQEAA